ncbi:MAG: bifunctional folylpolyglutamate synthase/dihydrofolate synthase [Saprospiraceae bacterium]|nr:bifunctional folylpolyglutamate synthase/dihydrofolate synthase [Saprospiraceae bacterium]
MKKIKKYTDVEAFLFRQLPMFQRIGPKAMKKDLTNIKYLSSIAGHPHSTFKSIHIAGTNGKGSTSFFLATLLHEMGLKVGLYTSPHYKSYRERIRVDARKISKSAVRYFVNELIEKGVFQSEFKPSFFEITVAMAFDYFSREKVDIAIIETGLGGRLDSTNIITPELSVITNIGMDHTNFLGNTLEKIAREKAGIIKKKIPVIIGRRQKETSSVFKSVARKMQSPLKYADEYNTRIPAKVSAMFPDYQLENMKTTLACLEELDCVPSKKQIRTAWTDGLTKWAFTGRYKIIKSKPRTIIDSAHNREGIQALFNAISNEDFETLHIVLAMVFDKDIQPVLKLLPGSARYYFSEAKIPRAMKKEELQEKAAMEGLFGKCYKSISSALGAARKKAKKKDLVLVTGSIFTVAEVA